MKIVIVTQEDPFYMPYFFKVLLNASPEDAIIDSVVIQKSLGKKSIWKLAKHMYEFYGIYSFIIQGIKFVCAKVIKKLYKLKLWSRSFSVEYFCSKAGVKVNSITDVNSEEFINYIKNNKVDLIVSVAASQIFKKQILETPKLGCINIHNAPLPDYRGMLPNFWQMYHGEEYSVMTIHEMVEKVDAGRIILQEKTRIEPGMTLDRLIKITKKKNAEALVKVLEMFNREEVEYKPLPDKKGSYFSFPTKDVVKEFRKRGYKII